MDFYKIDHTININVMEPEKCMEYKFFTCEEAINSVLVSDCCKFLIKAIKKYFLHDRF